ncbi:MAG TPA: hypothetical protein VGX25_23150 [Actinophytocola sp.]|uniref:hypothetical protein n=1 Tax=Actinophytocola sp. TaxID=1872138 RepID=UPI002DDD3093|nr:hypothetical protein [Actinophytocola sp.]HEV2782299.1 hypothetical protein [Actinophytocola sp.]
MASLGPDRGPLPDENRRRDRRVLRFELYTDHPVDDDLPLIMAFTQARTACGMRWQVLASRDGWLCLAERALGDWAVTLRAALLMLVGFAGAIVLIGVAFGFGGVVLGALLSLALYPAMLRFQALLAAGRPSR